MHALLNRLFLVISLNVIFKIFNFSLPSLIFSKINSGLPRSESRNSINDVGGHRGMSLAAMGNSRRPGSRPASRPTSRRGSTAFLNDDHNGMPLFVSFLTP